ncbi:MAG: alkaline phosphatase family protein [Anaerolineae bacterium]|nr:alkaline phosphatase family protein [Anaerolineae bacterium]MCO5193635.1 alkaline phosphatase family protein [Anaerolineae bacterium]
MSDSPTITKQPPKLIIIGFDGATLDLIEPWARAGHLPNFARLMAEGAWGELSSTIPAHSGPAWTTFATGLQPGKHGVYYFTGITRDDDYFRSVSSETIQSRTIWDLAGEQGQRVGVINVPLTYPPYPVNGYLISGIFAPDAVSAFWPPELHDEVTAVCGEYEIEVYGKVNRQAHFDAILDAMERRCCAAEYLIDNYSADFVTIVFRMLDSVQHKFWADMDPQHTVHNKLGKDAMPDAILECHKTLDTLLGRLLDKAGPETTVFILSDHGFRAEYGRLAINRWLRDQGLLSRPRGSASLLVNAMALAKKLGLTRILGTVVRSAEGAKYRQALADRKGIFYRSIDWSKTKVVYGPYYGFNINLKGRDPYGIVEPEEYEPLRDQLIRDLKALHDPETGLPIFAEIYKREDIYEGAAFDLAPDLIPELAEHVTDDGRRWGFGLNQNPAAFDLFTPPSLRMSADHAHAGMFMAKGPHIKSQHVTGLHIADVAPTALYALGLTVPEAMDGVVRLELFDETFTAQTPVTYDAIDLSVDTALRAQFSAEDESVVTMRLKDLGYL